MKKKSTSTLVILGRFGEAGFFNLHVLLELIIVFGSILLVLLGVGTFSDVSAQANVGSTASTRQQEQQATAQQVGQTTVIRPIHSDLSRPLRDQPVERLQVREEREAHVHPRVPIRHLDRPDPVIQSNSMISSPTAGSLHSSPRLAAQICRKMSASLFRRLVMPPVGGTDTVFISQTASSII